MIYSKIAFTVNDVVVETHWLSMPTNDMMSCHRAALNLGHGYRLGSGGFRAEIVTITREAPDEVVLDLDEIEARLEAARGVE